jgi:RecJ-like exonuclease
MLINKITCGQCFGKGRIESWKLAESDPISGTGLAVRTEITCPQCDGKGYIEYPVFTVEEAKVIAKHFGFNIIGDSANE